MSSIINLPGKIRFYYIDITVANGREALFPLNARQVGGAGGLVPVVRIRP